MIDNSETLKNTDKYIAKHLCSMDVRHIYIIQFVTWFVQQSVETLLTHVGVWIWTLYWVPNWSNRRNMGHYYKSNNNTNDDDDDDDDDDYNNNNNDNNNNNNNDYY